MALSVLKDYYDEAFDPKMYHDLHFFFDPDESLPEEAIIWPMKLFKRELRSGYIKGDKLIDISFGPIFFHLFPLCEFFKEITILESNVRSIEELEKWLNGEEGACSYDLSRIMLELGEDRTNGQEMEDNLRSTIKYILKCDFAKENPVDPVLIPKADCVSSIWILDSVSKDKKSYRRNLKNMSSLLKIGGHLIMIGCINCSFYLVGEHKFQTLVYDKKFVEESLAECGYVIKCYEAIENKEAIDLSDFEQLFFVVAQKL